MTNAMVEMDDFSLEAVTEHLFTRFEKEYVQDRKQAVDDHIARLKAERKALGMVGPDTELTLIGKAIKKEVIPAYEEFVKKRDVLLDKKNNRNWKPYVIATVGVLGVLEILALKGAAFRPQILAPSLLLETGLGYGLYSLQNFKDQYKVNKEQKKFAATVRGAQRRFIKDTAYNLPPGGRLNTELANLEISSTLANYNTPEDFWTDFDRALAIDPTNRDAYELADVNRLEPFLKSHIEGAYDEQEREHRFRKLSDDAHSHFLANDKAYLRKRSAN